MPGCNVSENAQKALVKYLLKIQLLDESALKQQASFDDRCPIALFAKQGLFDEDDALALVAKSLQVPWAIFDRNSVERVTDLLGHSNFEKLSLEYWRDIRAAPWELSGRHLVLAMANPLDENTRKHISLLLNCEVSIAIAREDDLLAVLAKKLNAARTIDLESLEEYRTDLSEEERGESNLTTADLSAPPVIRLVNKIITESIEARASDIHVTPEKNNLNVRVRIDGIMQQLFQVPAALSAPAIARLKLLAGMNIAERRRPQDGRLRVKTATGVKDLRISAVPSVFGENIVIRILSPEINKLTLSALGLEPQELESVKRALRGSSRVVLVTGPTGSGKTSTLYAALLHLMDGTKNIISVEDPIEYRVQGVTQIQVNTKIGVTFAEGLRSILRQDPDIIMVGEIRDSETATIAMQAAQTGHLVLSTLHTNDAAGAVSRLIDLGVPPYIVSSSLFCVVAQRLIRKLCAQCAQPLTPDEIAALPQLPFDACKIKKPSGCDECGQTGYRGRSGLYSVLEVSDEMRAAIRDKADQRTVEKLGRTNGFRSLEEVALCALESGTTSIEEIERSVAPLYDVLKSRGAAYVEAGSHTNDPVFNDNTALKRQRLLLVEDDENTRQVLSMLFEREMFEVVEAQDGLEGINKLYEGLPAIIICDMMMPRMNGHEFLKRVRQDKRTRHIPVLMLTAADTEANELKSFDSGADDFVSKTVDSKVMLARVQRLLSRAADA